LGRCECGSSHPGRRRSRFVIQWCTRLRSIPSFQGGYLLGDLLRCLTRNSWIMRIYMRSKLKQIGIRIKFKSGRKTYQHIMVNVVPGVVKLAHAARRCQTRARCAWAGTCVAPCSGGPGYPPQASHLRREYDTTTTTCGTPARALVQHSYVRGVPCTWATAMGVRTPVPRAWVLTYLTLREGTNEAHMCIFVILAS
jgi:hypothetical protein